MSIYGGCIVLFYFSCITCLFVFQSHLFSDQNSKIFSKDSELFLYRLSTRIDKYSEPIAIIVEISLLDLFWNMEEIQKFTCKKSLYKRPEKCYHVHVVPHFSLFEHHNKCPMDKKKRMDLFSFYIYWIIILYFISFLPYILIYNLICFKVDVWIKIGFLFSFHMLLKFPTNSRSDQRSMQTNANIGCIVSTENAHSFVVVSFISFLSYFWFFSLLYWYNLSALIK